MAKSGSDLQTHNDRLTDTQHEQTCKTTTLSAVTRELGQSHDVELERQDLPNSRKGRIFEMSICLCCHSPNDQGNPLTPGRWLPGYNVQFTYRQAAHSASTVTVTCSQSLSSIMGEPPVATPTPHSRPTAEVTWQCWRLTVMRIMLGMCACNTTAGRGRCSPTSLLWEPNRRLSVACELRRLRCCRAAG